MRLFTALDLPREIVANLEQFLDQVRPTARIKWSAPENLHITTKFIGEWPEERLDELKRSLAGIPSRPPILIHVRNVGFFPNPHSPHGFFCGIEAPGLEALAGDTDRATKALGIESESRAFNPHLTLARIKERPKLQALRERIAAMPSLDFGRFEASRFVLYHSRTLPTGSVYAPLAEFPLSK